MRPEMTLLECPKCHRKKRVPLTNYDPPGTARVEIQCDKCNPGDFDSPVFFDKDGNELSGDPETFTS